MPKRGTLGQLLVNSYLPQDMRDESRVLDKKGLSSLLREMALKYPEQYREVSHKLLQLGQEAAYSTGGHSFGLKHMKMTPGARAARQQLQAKIDRVLDDDNLSDEDRENLIVKLTGELAGRQQEEIFQEAIAADNPLAKQVQSGTRGNKMNLASLLGSDLLYTDHHDHVIPLPVLRSYSQGLTPMEYWAGMYGARKGTLATKFATRDAGFLSKQLNQISHRFVVTRDDDDRPDAVQRGFPVDVTDEDNEGALLARDMGGYKRNTILTPKILRHLEAQGLKRILVRSPAVSGAPDGGVYARDVGVRERGNLPAIGEAVGMAAAQALSEPLSQAQLSAKHSGGVAGAEKAVGGFDYINQLVQVPKTFKGGAAHAEVDGPVARIEKAPAGGSYIYVGGKQHYVPPELEIQVKPGQVVEAGDVLTNGFPNPAIVVQHKGIGEGRRYFINAYRDAMRGAGLKPGRRNIELLSRGLINHVMLTDEVGDGVPDDILPYSSIEHRWKPRPGARTVAPKAALGKYLERPYLHYTIGTQIRPSMLKDFDEFGVKDVDIHDEPPPWEPVMVRGMANLRYDPDWMTRMFGSGLKGSVLDAAHRGGVSDASGTSFVPSLAKAVNFGREGVLRPPKPVSPLRPAG